MVNFLDSHKTFLGQAYSLSLSELIREANILTIPDNSYRKLGGVFIPEFKRQIVWSEAQQIALVESFITGYPISSMVINVADEIANGERVLLDGQQRLNSFLRYFNNEIPVFGKFISEIDKPSIMGIKQTPIPVYYSKVNTVEEMKIIYNTLNFSGTKHELSDRAV